MTNTQTFLRDTFGFLGVLVALSIKPMNNTELEEYFGTRRRLIENSVLLLKQADFIKRDGRGRRWHVVAERNMLDYVRELGSNCPAIVDALSVVDNSANTECCDVTSLHLTDYYGVKFSTGLSTESGELSTKKDESDAMMLHDSISLLDHDLDHTTAIPNNDFESFLFSPFEKLPDAVTGVLGDFSNVSQGFSPFLDDSADLSGNASAESNVLPSDAGTAEKPFCSAVPDSQSLLLPNGSAAGHSFSRLAADLPIPALALAKELGFKGQKNLLALAGLSSAEELLSVWLAMAVKATADTPHGLVLANVRKGWSVGQGYEELASWIAWDFAEDRLCRWLQGEVQALASAGAEREAAQLAARSYYTKHGLGRIEWFYGWFRSRRGGAV